jgi:serine/threonine protein kinase
LRRCESEFIVGYKGAFQKGSSVWIAMQYCAGGSLSDVMQACGHTFSERQVACIMSMALRGLSALHQVGVIHRDIKGGNILADANGTCKLADFGVSSTLNHSLGKQRTIIGTPHWMAPGQHHHITTLNTTQHSTHTPHMNEQHISSIIIVNPSLSSITHPVSLCLVSLWLW